MPCLRGLSSTYNTQSPFWCYTCWSLSCQHGCRTFLVDILVLIFFHFLTVDNIQMHLGFDSICGDNVIGKNVTGTLFNVNALVRGVSGNAVYVNGVDQYVEFGGHKDRCFGNVSLCHHGFSFAFWMKLGNKSFGSGCQYIFTSVDVHYANGFETCRWKDGRIRTGVNLPHGRYGKSIDMVESNQWHHHGVTSSLSNGLTIISDGVLVRSVPQMRPANRSEWPHETEISLGRLPRNPLNPEYMSEVTVDELYFWERWLPNLQMWKVYATSISV